MKRIENTVADNEAKSYEAQGILPKEAWGLVEKNFLERTKNISLGLGGSCR